MSDEELTKRFTNFMLTGYANGQFGYLRRMLPRMFFFLMNKLAEICSKYPLGQPLNDDMILEGRINKVCSIINEITSETIIKASIQTKGSAGPSMLGRRVLTK